MSTEAPASTFTLDAPWALDPQVAVRPERFGALLYHFGTRRLSFLKSTRLLDVVNALADAPTARAACTAAGVDAAELPRYEKTLAALADSHMIQPAVTRADRSTGTHD